MQKCKSFFVALSIMLSNFAFAQVEDVLSDSLKQIKTLKASPKDSTSLELEVKDSPVKIISPPIENPEPLKSSVHSPKKASLLSAALPGAGQFYNKKYWKIPIVYIGFGALAYSAGFNSRFYRSYKNELINRQQNTGNLNLELERYSDANLDELQSFYRRNRDLSYIGMALLYMINIVDATVDAHLFDFDMSDNLSLRISSNENDIIAQQFAQPRLKLSYKF